MDDAVEAHLRTAEACEHTSDDPKKGSEEVLFGHNDELSNNSSQGVVAEGLDRHQDQDADVQGSNALNIDAPSDGTGSSAIPLAEKIVEEHGTASTSTDLSMAQATDNSEKATRQGCTIAHVAQATRAETLNRVVPQINSLQARGEIEGITGMLAKTTVSNLPTREPDGALASSLKLSHENLGISEGVPSQELSEHISKFAEACGIPVENVMLPGDGDLTWEQLYKEVADIKCLIPELKAVQPFFHLKGLGDCAMAPIKELKALVKKAGPHSSRLYQAVDAISRELESGATGIHEWNDPVTKSLLFPFEEPPRKETDQDAEARLRRGQIFDHACLSRAMELLALVGANPQQDLSRGLISAYKNVQHQHHDRASLHGIYQTQLNKVRDMKHQKTQVIDELVKEKSLAKRKAQKEKLVSLLTVQMEAIDAALQETHGLPVLAAQLGGMAFDKANDIRTLRSKLSASADHEARLYMRMAEECSAAAMLAEEIAIQKDVIAKQTAYQSEEARKQPERNRIVKLFWEWAEEDVDIDGFEHSMSDMLPPDSDTGTYNVPGGVGTSLAKMFPDVLIESGNRHNFTLSGTGKDDRLTKLDSELARPNAAPESPNIAMLQAIRKQQLVSAQEFLNGHDKPIPNRIPKKQSIEQRRPVTFGLTATHWTTVGSGPKSCIHRGS
jgi:hypothetical protein